MKRNTILEEGILMILLQLNRVARFFGAEVLFENVQMEIQDHSRIALVGRNGAGKSTLLKIIAGLTRPDEGEVIRTKNTKLAYLAQNTGLDTDNTVWNEMLSAFDEVRQMEKRMHEIEQEMAKHPSDALMNEYDRLQHDFNDRNGYGYESEIRSVLHGFQFDESYYTRPINTLSGGQKTRLALARMLLEKPSLLILDEPTNHLDIATLNWLESYLKNYQGALLIVSHDRYFLDQVVNEVYELSHHTMTHYHGNYTRYTEEKAARQASEQKQYQKQQAQISKMEDFISRNMARASTTKRAQSRLKQLEKMEKMEAPQRDERSAHFLFHIHRPSGNVVLQMENGAIGYDDTILSEPIQLDIRRQEAIALVGPNGIGKSTLLKTIVGQLPLLKGQFHLGTNVEIGYYDQEQHNLHPNKDVLHELWDEHPTTQEKEIRHVLGAFLFTGEAVEKPISLLSGGEKARLLLAKLAMQEENFLVLDEPTNHLDLDSKEVLENALIQYEGTLFFVSHDRYFINRIATKVVELSPEGSKLYMGNYDYYLEKKAEEEELQRRAVEQVEEDKTSTETKAPALDREQQKQQRRLQRNITRLEEQMEELENQAADIEQEMQDPAIANDHEQLATLQQQLEDIQQQLDNTMDEWENASIEFEAFQ